MPGLHWGSFEPQSAASVPSSGASKSEEDPIAALMAQIPQVTEREIQAAATPIAGPHAAQMPSSLTTPITPHQDTPLNTRPVVGAGNARARGIGNTITAVMNGLGRVVTAEAQNKQNQIRDAATKVMEAQQAVDQWEQQARMTTDPKQAAYFQKQAEEARNTRDGVFADPKMRKALVKGFNFNYTDPTQNKTTEHAAVQEALKGLKTKQEKIAAIKELRAKQNAAAGATAGAAYAKAQPRGLAPNVQAQMQLQAKMEQQKNYLESLKALAPVFSARIKAGADMNKAEMESQVKLRVAAVDYQRDIDKQLLENKQHDIDNAAARGLAKYKASLDAWVKQIDTTKPSDIMKGFETAGKDYQTQLTDIQKSRQALNAEIDKKPSASRVIELRRQLTALDAQQATATNAFNAASSYAAKMTGLDINQFKVDVPTVHVGDGANATTTAKPAAASDSTDIDPRTGKPFSSSVPTADRILIRAHHELGEAGIGASRILGNVNRESKRVKQFFGTGESN